MPCQHNSTDFQDKSCRGFICYIRYSRGTHASLHHCAWARTVVIGRVNAHWSKQSFPARSDNRIAKTRKQKERLVRGAVTGDHSARRAFRPLSVYRYWEIFCFKSWSCRIRYIYRGQRDFSPVWGDHSGLRMGSREEERRKLADIINHWNANRLDLFEISQPTEVSPWTLSAT